MKTIAVIGAGTMGAGIAQLAARHGCAVRLIDVNTDVLRRATETIGERLARSVQKGRISADEREAVLERITTSNAIRRLNDVELAVEAVVEDLTVKHKVFAALDESVPGEAILTTNTSSLSITRIAEAVKKNPGRVVGMHFFNPAPVMPLVEVIAGDRSEKAAVSFACEAARALGKTPVRVKDTPGFIVNRVARGFYLEALRLLGEGVAGVDEIDNVLRTHGKFKMGPFELMDLIGVDVNLAVSTSVWEQFDKHPRFAPHKIQRTLVEQGHLGRKTGRGFYLYDAASIVPAQPVERKSLSLSPLLADALLGFCSKAATTGTAPTEQYMLGRILTAIMNEAALAHADGVAGSADIDTAMVLGTNYPKGPLAWADEIGRRTVRGVLKGLNDSVADGRYEPAPCFAEAE